MERMVNRRLTQFIRDNELLDHRQHAFRQGSGTSTYFATLGQVLDDALTNDLHVDLATLDLSKAYNRTWTPGVLKTLASWGIGGNTFTFIRNFLTKRTFQVCIGNTKSNSFPEETGVPQGSVLAVTLFLISMNGVFEVLPHGVFIFVFADDIVIVVTGRRPTLIRRKLQSAIAAVHAWASSVGFELSPSKSRFSHLCSGKHHARRNPPRIDGEEVPYEATIRILGIYLDRHLSFQPHCDRIKKQCESRVNLLRTITSKHTKNNRDMGLRIMKAIICSKLLYGAELLCRNSDVVIGKFSPIFNRSIRTVSGLLPCTPATSACIEAGILPFRHMFAIAVCSKATSFLEKTTGDDEGVFLLKEANKLLENLAHQKLPPVSRVHWVGDEAWDSSPPRIIWKLNNPTKQNLNPATVVPRFNELVRKTLNGYELIYTDGSKTASHVGYGVFGTSFSTSRGLPKPTSIFSAEATAILSAVTESSSTWKAIITDSASVLKALESPKNRHPLVQAIRMASNSNTVYFWVPSHCGIRGNEVADKMASDGRTKSPVNAEVPAMDVKHWVKTIIASAWHNEWHNTRDLFLRKIKGDPFRWRDTLH